MHYLGCNFTNQFESNFDCALKRANTVIKTCTFTYPLGRMTSVGAIPVGKEKALSAAIDMPLLNKAMKSPPVRNIKTCEFELVIYFLLIPQFHNDGIPGL